MVLHFIIIYFMIAILTTLHKDRKNSSCKLTVITGYEVWEMLGTTTAKSFDYNTTNETIKFQVRDETSLLFFFDKIRQVLQQDNFRCVNIYIYASFFSSIKEIHFYRLYLYLCLSCLNSILHVEWFKQTWSKQ